MQLRKLYRDLNWMEHVKFLLYADVNLLGQNIYTYTVKTAQETY